VEIGQVYVTVGTATAATAQSLAEGNVDLAFLPAEDYVLYGQKSAVLLADAPQPQIVPDGDSTAPADWNGQEKRYHTTNTTWEGGTASLICTAPTEYGRQLAKRAASGTALSWKELDNARWGVLAAHSDGGYRCANLYLADHYDGKLLSDLSSVTVYDSYQDLLRAAAAEEIDVLVLRKDARIDVADAWMLERSRISQRGVGGFGRQEPIWEEVSCVAVTEPLYTAVAAVSTEQEVLLAEPFQTALRSVLKRLRQEEPELMGVLGSPRFVPVEDDALDALRRTLTIEGRTA
jgi:phosphonate transport system substrate-binding protein